MESKTIRKDIQSILRKDIQKKEWIFLIADKIEIGKIPDVDKLLWLGIGGSSSGPKGILRATGDPSVEFFESPEDRYTLVEKLSEKSKDRKVIYIVSKSGETFETEELVMDIIKQQKKQKSKPFFPSIVVNTMENSPLYKLASKFGWRKINFPPELSGRFSTFFIIMPYLRMRRKSRFISSAMEKVRRELENPNSLHFKIAEFMIENEETSQEIFLCFYSRALFEIGENISQLIGESLGKDGRGMTPVPLLGPHFQHSVAQLILANPKRKCAIFIIPDYHPKYRANIIEAQTTFQVFSEKIPVMRVEVKQTLSGITEFLFSFQIAVAICGSVIGINPFDQPEVKRIRDLLRKRERAIF